MNIYRVGLDSMDAVPHHQCRHRRQRHHADQSGDCSPTRARRWRSPSTSEAGRAWSCSTESALAGEPMSQRTEPTPKSDRP